ncbi:zinc finger protein 518A [Thalassophryne amazonica]|uniref:zinc finger protein 518A n=1 Tax=Thalassophryne amazonica TaxID=390379 RepID=UPI001471C54F|nr:zinc finger protein 518A [Thalassophryne amazonica]
MDSMDICAATSMGDNWCGKKKKNRDWHKRPLLRKSTAQPPTMQSKDKRGPKIAEERAQNALRPSSKKSPHEAQHSPYRTNDSGNTLRFTCSQCKDNLEFVPKDLLRHFEENHSGSLPNFPCHLCTFSTHEFSYLQVHVLSHKDSLSNCSICNDHVQRTWSDFITHLTVSHCQNGKYSCNLCSKFSTCDVKVFLEHIHTHNVGVEGANDLLFSTKDFEDHLVPKTAAYSFSCQHCGYEATHKWLITKHINTVHVSCHGNKKNKMHSITIKPDNSIPQIRPRLTRSAVRECWLTQDCLSLPGREFLDKYCHLSDRQTTLEETQQFLMKSVTGQAGDRKWTKALQSVLSNVPQDINIHSKAENGITTDSGFSDSSKDLAVLTVKNKITVAQNGTAYAKRFKRMASEEKETFSPESTVAVAHCGFDQNGCQSSLTEQTQGSQFQTKLNDQPSECTQMQENRENRELKCEKVIEEHSQKYEAPKNIHSHDDAVNISSELKLTNQTENQNVVNKVQPKHKRKNLRWKRKKRSKTMAKGSSGLSLKLVLKKNPVKEKQWVSQSPVLPDDHHDLPNSQTMLEETAQALSCAMTSEVYRKMWSKDSKTYKHSPSKAMTSAMQSKLEAGCGLMCATKTEKYKNIDEEKPALLERLPSTHPEMYSDTELSPLLIGRETDGNSSTGKRIRINLKRESEAAAELCPENMQLPASNGDADCHMSAEKASAADGVSSQSNNAKCSPLSQPVTTTQDDTCSEDSSLTLSLEMKNQSVEESQEREVPVDACPGLLGNTHSPSGRPIQQETSPASADHWQPVPKHVERTLKLIAINPSQLIKRPSRDQPVVVLNHPDADIPEVTKIMEVVNRYREDVQKVVLSDRTLSALSALEGEVSGKSGATSDQTESFGSTLVKNSVQERFILKLKLRRLSRKKYEVIDGIYPCRDVVMKFRCWFCGRVFENQEMWMVHRQRHLMEWKRPNYENS